jgi:hypothetical protein
MKVYISLPITGQERSAKIRSGKAKRRLEGCDGITAVTPFEVCDGIVGEADYAEYMGRDIAALLRCDAVCFLSGWQNSKGCVLEHHAAEVYGKQIIYLNDKPATGK